MDQLVAKAKAKKQRIDLAAKALQAEGLQPDPAFLRERLLTMYANPVFNQEKAK